MKMPTFTAEAALAAPQGHYRAVGFPRTASSALAVIPQLRLCTGCKTVSMPSDPFDPTPELRTRTCCTFYLFGPHLRECREVPCE